MQGRDPTLQNMGMNMPSIMQNQFGNTGNTPQSLQMLQQPMQQMQRNQQSVPMQNTHSQGFVQQAQNDPNTRRRMYMEMMRRRRLMQMRAMQARMSGGMGF